MASFAVEAAVRRKFQLEDAAVVSAELVQASIDDAHLLLIARLDPEVDTVSPPDAVVLGETLLAGACLLASLASKDAAEQRELTIGGQRIGPGKRFASLMAMSSKAERRAWEALAPYLAAAPGETPARVTDSQAVLGAE